jgi:hypothetical protein
LLASVDNLYAIEELAVVTVVQEYGVVADAGL